MLQLGYSSEFYSQAKDSTSLRHEGGPRVAQRRGLNLSWLPPFIHLSSPCRACPMQIGLAKKGVCLFHLSFSLRSADFLLLHFRGLFLFFVFLHRHFGLLFSYSKYLTASCFVPLFFLNNNYDECAQNVYG